jgi:hypothetical protein
MPACASAPVTGNATTWRQSLEAGQQALKEGDTQYGYFKLRQAWLNVEDRTNFRDPAYREICKAFGLSASDENLEAFNSHLTPGVNGWSVWTITKSADGTLSLSAPRQIFCSTSRCWNGIPETELAQYIKGSEHLIALYRSLPIKITPNSPKYADLLSLCGPMKVVEPMPVTFNLSPFTPPEYTPLFGPIAIMQSTGIAFDYWFRGLHARIGAIH